MCLCSQEEFTSRPRPERTTRASTPPSCTSVRRWDFFCCLFTYRSVKDVRLFLALLGFFFICKTLFFSHGAAIERHQDVMHFDFHFLWELWITGCFPLMLREKKKNTKILNVCLVGQKDRYQPPIGLFCIFAFSGWVIRVQSSGAHYIWLRFLQDGRSNIQTWL